jgi:hypothetical protein
LREKRVFTGLIFTRSNGEGNRYGAKNFLQVKKRRAQLGKLANVVEQISLTRSDAEFI